MTTPRPPPLPCRTPKAKTAAEAGKAAPKCPYCDVRRMFCAEVALLRRVSRAHTKRASVLCIRTSVFPVGSVGIIIAFLMSSIEPEDHVALRRLRRKKRRERRTKGRPARTAPFRTMSPSAVSCKVLSRFYAYGPKQSVYRFNNFKYDEILAKVRIRCLEYESR